MTTISQCWANQVLLSGRRAGSVVTMVIYVRIIVVMVNTAASVLL